MNKLPYKVITGALVASMVTPAIVATPHAQAETNEIQSITFEADDSTVEFAYDEFASAIFDESSQTYEFVSNHKINGIGMDQDTYVKYDDFANEMLSNEDENRNAHTILNDLSDKKETTFTEDKVKEVKPYTTTHSINVLSDNKVEMNGYEYTLGKNVQSIFSNPKAFENAKASVRVEDGVITKVNELHLNASGSAENPLVLNASDATVHGAVHVAGNHVSIKGLTVAGNLQVEGSNIEASDVTVEGQLKIDSASYEMSSVSDFAVVDQNLASATAEHGMIFVKSGSYNIDEQWTISKNVTVIGVGEVSVQATADKQASWGNANGAKHLISLQGSEATLKNLSIDAIGTYGVNTYNQADVTLENVQIDNGQGAALTVNGSSVQATELATSGNAWGAVNVDPGSGVETASTFTMNSGSLNEAVQVWSDGSNVSEKATVSVSLPDAFEKQAFAGMENRYVWTTEPMPNTASITQNGETTLYQSLTNAVDAAQAGTTIELAAGTYKLSEQLTLEKNTSIVGEGDVTVQAEDARNWSEANGSKHLLLVSGAEASVKNVTFDAAGTYGVNTYAEVDLTLENVSIQNSKGAGLTVNGSTVEATNLQTSGNGWGAVNVDPGSGVTTTSSFTMNSGSLNEEAQVWSDGSNVTQEADVQVTLPEAFKKKTIEGTQIWTTK
ncbi:hypothetical protein [Pontibacillus yanchengensis]|uniref:Right handed beta helix domain-containing protein n=1 Tax=Pontibacillus yanchengensis Y32 TaxID=1385514 RepID=A0A0A2TGJ9_9BACI|nr:hypothetical protein [Pontibacillus yanchengensis]KGP74699.1 hypothetical protein N782_00645 [Pontibacillus yanchengensis Y32]